MDTHLDNETEGTTAILNLIVDLTQPPHIKTIGEESLRWPSDSSFLSNVLDGKRDEGRNSIYTSFRECDYLSRGLTKPQAPVSQR